MYFRIIKIIQLNKLNYEIRKNESSFSKLE